MARTATAQRNKPAPASGAQPLPETRASTSQAELLERAAKAGRDVKIGRPKTYHPALCKRVIQLGTVGKSWSAIAREFGISRATLYDWDGLYPEFRDALARARAAAQAYWEDDIHEQRTAKHYQAQSVKSFMGAQFEDYREVRATGLEALPDFLAAITEVATGRKIDRAAAAKPVELASSFEVIADQVKAKE